MPSFSEFVKQLISADGVLTTFPGAPEHRSPWQSWTARQSQDRGLDHMLSPARARRNQQAEVESRRIHRLPKLVRPVNA